MNKKIRRPKHKFAPFSLIPFMAISSEDANELKSLKGVDKANKVSLILEEKGFVEFQFPEHNKTAWIHENGIQVWKDAPDYKYRDKPSYSVIAVTRGPYHLGNHDQKLRSSSRHEESWYNAGGEKYEHIMFDIKADEELSLFTNSRNSYFAYLKNENILPARQYACALNSDEAQKATPEMVRLAEFLGFPTPKADIISRWYYPPQLDANKVKNAGQFRKDVLQFLDLDATRRAGLAYYLEGITSVPDSDQEKLSEWNNLALEFKECRNQNSLGDCPDRLVEMIVKSEPLSTGYNALSFFANSGMCSPEMLKRIVEETPVEKLKQLTNMKDFVGFTPALYALDSLYSSVDKAWPVFESWGDKIGWENLLLSSEKVNWPGILFKKEDSFIFKDEISNQWTLKLLNVVKQNKGLAMPDSYRALIRSKYLGVYEVNENLFDLKQNIFDPRHVAQGFKEETLTGIHKLLEYRMEMLIKENVKNVPSTPKPPSLNRF